MTKWKILGSLITLGLFLMGIVLWKVDRFLKNDHTVLIENQMRSQVSTIALILGNEANSVRSRLLNLMNQSDLVSGKSSQVDWKNLSSYSGVFIVHLSRGPHGSRGLQSQNKTQEFYSSSGLLDIRILNHPDFIGTNYNLESIKKQIENFIITSSQKVVSTKTPLKSGEPQTLLNVEVEILNNQSKKKQLVYFIRSGDIWMGLIGSPDWHQSIVDAQIDSHTTINIVNKNGITLGFTSKKEYIGSKLSVDSIFKEAEKTGLSQGRGFFEVSPNLKVLSVYQKVPYSESYVIETIPLNLLISEHQNVIYQISFLFMGVLTLLFAVIYALLLPIESSFRSIKDRIRSLTLGSSQFEPKGLIPEAKEIDDLLAHWQSQKVIKKSSSLPIINQLQGQLEGSLPLERQNELQSQNQNEDKISVYMKIVSAIGLELRSPLTTILGYAQGILARTQDPQVEKAAQSIVSETRGTRLLLEKMFGFAGVRTPNQSEIQMSIPLKQALNKLNEIFIRKGIHLVKDFEITPPFMMSSEDMAKAFECLLMNSVEAMERMSSKQLTVKCLMEGDDVIVSIIDTGEGIDREDIDKVFDPFFTTRPYSNHLGLGISIAVGIFKELGGIVTIESERGRGTTVKISFPIQFDEKENKDEFVEISASKLSKDVPVVKDKELEMINMFNLERKEIELKPLDKPVFDLNIDHLLEELPETTIPHIESKYSFLPDSLGSQPLERAFDEQASHLLMEEGMEYTKSNKASIAENFGVEIRRPRKR